MPRVAWLGTGLMGAPMARRLLAAGFEVTAWNRTPERAAALAADGARLAATPADAVAAGEIVFTMLRDGEVTRAALFDGAPPPELSGRTIVQMGTIGSAAAGALARAVAEAGGEYLEAPVLGSIPQASAGRLLVFGGGDAALFARLLPELSCLGSEPRRVGTVEQAAILKLALNQIIPMQAATFCLSLAMVRRSGIEVERFMEILRGSAFHSPSFDARLGRYLARDYERPNFPLELLGKDVELAREEARHLDLPTVTLDAVEALIERALERDLGRADYGALYEAIDPPR
jgi:3-hydroxyisobutyrate dehydrogenase